MQRWINTPMGPNKVHKAMHTFTVPWSKSYCSDIGKKIIGFLINNAWQTGYPWGSKSYIICKYQLEKIFNAKYKKVKTISLLEKRMEDIHMTLKQVKILNLTKILLNLRKKNGYIWAPAIMSICTLEEPWEVKVKKQIGENSCKTYNTRTCV